jgi:hypothetical protein
LYLFSLVASYHNLRPVIQEGIPDRQAITLCTFPTFIPIASTSVRACASEPYLKLLPKLK